MLKEKTPPIPLVIAHRGASALAPENTLAAFNLALELGADGIELDVMLTSDNQLVVIHDATVERTTNGHGKVASFTYEELSHLDAGSKFNPAFNNQHLPSLSEVYESFGGRMLINVELKNYTHPFDNLAPQVVQLTREYQLIDSVIFSSFNPFNLSRVRKIEPKIKLGLLTFPGKSGTAFRAIYGGLFPFDALHPYYQDVTAEMVLEQHKLGRQVNPWTVDNPDELKRLQAFGVDMLICNDPAKARVVLEG